MGGFPVAREQALIFLYLHSAISSRFVPTLAATWMLPLYKQVPVPLPLPILCLCQVFLVSDSCCKDKLCFCVLCLLKCLCLRLVNRGAEKDDAVWIKVKPQNSAPKQLLPVETRRRSEIQPGSVLTPLFSISQRASRGPDTRSALPPR